MACGVPAVATNVGGVPELISHGADGFLEKPGDIAAQAARAIALLSDANLHGKMAQAARQTALTRFCTERIIPQYEKYYEEILERN